MWKLLRFLKPYRKESICAPLFKLLEVVFELLVPLVVAHMIDSGIGGADKGIIVRSVLLMITWERSGWQVPLQPSILQRKLLLASGKIFAMP